MGSSTIRAAATNSATLPAVTKAEPNGELRSPDTATDDPLAQLSAPTPEELQQVVDDPLMLDSRDDAEELIQALPVQSFVAVARALRDEERLDLILPHATAEQIVGIFDLDSWERDRLAIPRAREWLDRIATAYRESDAERGRLADLIYDTDVEMWVLANTHATAIAELDEPDDDELRQRVLEDMAALQTWETPDRFFVIGVPDTELGRMTLRVLMAIYDDSITEGRKLISAIKWSLPSEMEEGLLRWRKGRLADLGFPEWEEAMRLFSPLAREQVSGELDEPEPEPEPGSNGDGDAPPPRRGHVRTSLDRPAPTLSPAVLGGSRDILRRVMQRLDNEEYDLRLREFLLLVNELMAAQRFEPGDLSLQERALTQAQATLNLACELLLAGQPQDDPEAFIADRITSVGLRQMFRFGYGPLAKLRKAALTLHRDGQVSMASLGSLLDRPWGPALVALSGWFPELPVDGKAKRRPLRGLADVARATAAIGEAGALAKLCFSPEGYGVDPVWLNRADEPERLRLGDLIRTAVIHVSQPGTSEAGLKPLAAADLSWARDSMLAADGHIKAEIRAEFIARVQAIGAAERAEALADVLLPRLAVELSGLELDGDDQIDLTRASGILTIQQVGVWLSTTFGG